MIQERNEFRSTNREHSSCAELWATSAGARPWIICWPASAASNIAATTARAGHARPGRPVPRHQSGRPDRHARSRLDEQPTPGSLGIGHTRWATHGSRPKPTPIRISAASGSLALVHNGVIENYLALKERLIGEGYDFRQLDRHRSHRPPDRQLPGRMRSPPRSSSTPASRYALPVAAVQEALSKLRGTYGLAILFRDCPDVIVAARLGSPLVVGVGHGEHFVASDASPLAGYTDKIVYLADHQIAVVTADTLRSRPSRTRATSSTRVHDLRHRIERRRARRLSALHAQGNLRAARSARKRHARPALTTTTPPPHFGGLNLTPQQLRQRQPHHPHRLRHQLARGPGRRIPDRRARPHSGRSRIRQRAALSQPAASTRARCCSPSRKAAKRPTRWPPCAK